MSEEGAAPPLAVDWRNARRDRGRRHPCTTASPVPAPKSPAVDPCGRGADALSVFAALQFRDSPLERFDIARFAVPIPAACVHGELRPVALWEAVWQSQRRVTASGSCMCADLFDGRARDSECRWRGLSVFWSHDSLQIGFFRERSSEAVSLPRVATSSPSPKASRVSTVGHGTARAPIFSRRMAVLHVVDQAGGKLTRELAESGRCNQSRVPAWRATVPLCEQTDEGTTRQHQGVYVGSLDGMPPVRVLEERVKTE